MGNSPNKYRQPQNSSHRDSLMDENDQPSMIENIDSRTDHGLHLRNQDEYLSLVPAFSQPMTQVKPISKLPETLKEAVNMLNEMVMMNLLLASPHYDAFTEMVIPIYDPKIHELTQVFVPETLAQYYESVELMNAFSLTSMCDLQVSTGQNPLCLVEMTLGLLRGLPDTPRGPVPAVQHHRQGPNEYPPGPLPVQIPRRPTRPNLNQLGIQANQIDQRALNARRAVIEGHIRRRMEVLGVNNRRIQPFHQRDESQLDLMLDQDPGLEVDLIACQGGKRMLVLPLKPQRKGNPIECIICQEEVSKTEAQVAVLECLHWFHFDCFETWGKTNPVCPCCKRDAVFVHVTTDPGLLTPPRESSRQGSGANTPVRQVRTPSGEGLNPNEDDNQEAPTSNKSNVQVFVATDEAVLGNIFDPSIIPEDATFAIVATKSLSKSSDPSDPDHILPIPATGLDSMIQEVIPTALQVPNNLPVTIDPRENLTNNIRIPPLTQETTPGDQQMGPPPVENQGLQSIDHNKEFGDSSHHLPNPVANIPEQMEEDRPAEPTITNPQH